MARDNHEEIRLTGYGLYLVRRHGRYSRPDFARHLKRRREAERWGRSIGSVSGVQALEHVDEVPTRYVAELRRMMGDAAFLAGVRHARTRSTNAIIEEEKEKK